MEIAGPTKNGGIGTHCYYLAKFLRQKMGHEVTVLLGWPTLDDQGSSYWKSFFRKKLDIEFEHIGDYPPFSDLPGSSGLHYAHKWSLNLYNRLRDGSYDICHFQDNNATGFVSAMAKKTGLHFRNTLFTCTLHSPDQWIRRANRQYSHAGGKDMHMDYMEKQATEMCDYLVAPVNYMLKYAKGLGWEIEDKSRVIPYLIDDIEKTPQREFNQKHLIFFGRLETRKGLEIFVNSLLALIQKKKFREKKLQVTFLGKTNHAHGPDALQYLYRHQKNLPPNHKWEFKIDLDHFQAVNYLRQHSDALVVIPSPIDNSPYTVIECLQMGLNVIASSAGGIPELFGSEERLFAPDVEHLSAKLEEVFHKKLPGLSPDRYSRDKAESEWTRFINYLEEELAAQKKGPHIGTTPSETKTCVLLTQNQTNGNLAKALDSLEKQTNGNFKLVAATDSLSDSQLESLRKSHGKKYWSFVKNSPDKNDGSPVSGGQNINLWQTDCQYLIFMGNDCLAEPAMVDTLQIALEEGNLDAATCYYRNFSEGGKSRNHFCNSRYFYGNSPELGLLNNGFGEGAFIVKSDIFRSLGGFTVDPDNITPEWEFFIRFSLRGHKLAVVPEFLFQRRLTPHAGPAINPYSYYYSHRKSIEPLLNGLGEWERNIASNLLGVNHMNESRNAMLYRLNKGQPIINPENYFDRELTKLQNNYYHLLKIPLLYNKYRKKLLNLFQKKEVHPS